MGQSASVFADVESETFLMSRGTKEDDRLIIAFVQLGASVRDGKRSWNQDER